MKQIKFECRSVTPMFMYGADGSTPELRPASIKGILRFWWRAIHGDLGLKELHELEGKIFGSTEGRSKVNLRIANVQKNQTTFESLIKDIAVFDGIKYNLYTIFMKNKDESCDKSCFDSLSFDLIVSGYDNDALEQAVNTLIYLNFFGAIGSRSRRGAGSIKISVKENNDKLFEKKLNLLDTSKIKTKEALRKHIDNILQTTIPSSSSNYTTFYKHLYIFDPEQDWKQALETVAKPFKEFRNSNQSRVLETPNFGFPIRHKNGSVFVGGKVKKDNKLAELAERRASPLFFKVFRANDGLYFPILLWMDGDLLPDKYEIVSKPKKNNKDEKNTEIKRKKPNEKIINEFIGTLDKTKLAEVSKNG